MKRIIYLTMLGFFALTTVAHAEWIKGTVLDVDDSNNTITIKRANELEDNNRNLPPQIPERLQLKVRDDASFKNLSSLSELQAGNEVRVNVKTNKYNSAAWEASDVELTDASNAAAPGHQGEYYKVKEIRHEEQIDTR
jgi:hypothetical protein